MIEEPSANFLKLKSILLIHLNEKNENKYIRELIDIGYFVKQKEIENRETKKLQELEIEAHIKTLISHEILLLGL